MEFLARLRAIDESDKTQAVKKLIKDATPDFDFFLMMILSILMATFGLLAGSETIVIGSMLIAPILHPVMGLALGVSMSNGQLINRSIRTIVKAVALGLGASVAATVFFSFSSSDSGLNDIVMSRTSPSLLFLAVAVISGLAVSYTLVKRDLSETLPGIAVSVALIPPLAVIGIGIAQFNLHVITGASVMLLVNIFGVVGASMFAFSLMDVHGKKKIADKAIEKEEERVEEENIRVEKVEKETEPHGAEV